MAHAQTNLDQGKSAAQIFAGACAECHKAAHGLANGKNSATLTDFLREHYTTSRDQAAALAAYVLGGRGAEPVTPGQGHPQKPSEPASASAEESKPAKHQGPHAAKPEEHPPAAAKLQRPGSETAKPEEEANPGEQPTIMSPDVRPTTASRSRRREPKPSPAEAPAAVAHVPAAAVTDPGSTETPRQEASPNPSPAAATPPGAPAGESGDNPPLPRDDVPD